MNDSDRQFQYELLQGVARTFAFTIPQLPPALADVVANAYLLCRIADTIEDETAITVTDKCTLAEQFIRVVAGDTEPHAFALRFYALLSAQRLAAEKKLIQETPRVIAITHGFNTRQQAALLRCVSIMSKGMVYYQAHCSAGGLETVPQLNNYCYHVAGVVGEMLTELCCEYSPAMATQKSRLMELAVSFGQGLQMTNILKDIWEDYARGVCWLPRDLFKQSGFNLDHLPDWHQNMKFAIGLKQLIVMCRSHLQNAADYIALIPYEESGLRKFCLWSVGMALLTLKNIYRKPGFESASQIKIGKLGLLSVIAMTQLVHRNHLMTNMALKLWSRFLPPCLSVSTDRAHQVIDSWFNQHIVR